MMTLSMHRTISQQLHILRPTRSSRFCLVSLASNRQQCWISKQRIHNRREQKSSSRADSSIRSSFNQAEDTAGMAPELKAAVEEFLAKHKVVLFMKGTKQFPQCGFSNTCVQILNMMKVPYETINILEDESLRHGMKAYSQWPTFPQVYINSEFVGGCDIMIEAYQNGELQEMLEVAISS